MATNDDKTAYIKTVREDGAVRYIAKVFNKKPAPITKAQYNHIVKALRDQDWRNTVEDETSIINQIINRSLTVAVETDEE